MTDVSTFREAFTDALRMWEEGKDRTVILSELESAYGLEREEAQHIADLVADVYSKLTKSKHWGADAKLEFKARVPVVQFVRPNYPGILE